MNPIQAECEMMMAFNTNDNMISRNSRSLIDYPDEDEDCMIEFCSFINKRSVHNEMNQKRVAKEMMQSVIVQLSYHPNHVSRLLQEEGEHAFEILGY